MNSLEKKMYDVLKSLRDNYGVIAVKAEFEAEGTRIDELLRLIEIVRKCDLKLGIKIGGCEAMKDLMECKQLGTDYIIAPMVETEYALKKYIEAKNKIYNNQERKYVEFLINIETKTSKEHLTNMIDVNESYNDIDKINGLVFGRVDYSLSCDIPRNDINDNDKITNDVIEVSEVANRNNLSFVVGGGVSLDSLEIMKKIKKTKLDRFETRKIIFSSEALKLPNLNLGMLEAVNFELLWLKNKKNYYEAIFKEDDKRIAMLSDRWKV